jgi:hypothetical protein
MASRELPVGDAVALRSDGRCGVVEKVGRPHGVSTAWVRIPELDGVGGTAEYVVYGDPGLFELVVEQAKVFTVFGLVDLGSQELTVAAVVEGDVPAVDDDSSDGDTMRWAQSFEAESPEEAEELAVAQVAAGS